MCVCVCVCSVLVAQSCLTLPSSSVHGVFQARRLEWLAISSLGDFSDPGIKPKSPALQAYSLLSVHIYICGIHLLIHSPVHGQHLGWYHILAIVNNSDMNIGMHISFQVTVFFFFSFSFSLSYIPGVELLDQTETLFIVLWGSYMLFTTVAVPIYIHINSVQRFPLLHVLANICYL